MESKSIVYFFSILFLCVINLLYMHNYIMYTCQVEGLIEWTSWFDNFFRVLFDVWVVLTLSMIISLGRIRVSVAVTFAITLLWSFCNVLYSRFFGHYITYSAIAEVGAISNSMVFNSMISAFKWIDVFYIVNLLLFLFLIRRIILLSFDFKRYARFSSILFGCLLIANLLTHVLFCSLSPDLRYWGYYKRRVGMRIFGQNHLLALPIFSHFNNGSVKTLVLEAFLNIKGDIELTEEQRKTIDNQLELSRETIAQTRTANDCIKNVIFILVESYMSFVTDMKIDGKEVTPFMNTLKCDSMVYYNGCVHPNITLGESADGQFIYMTGMLPLRSIITVSKAHKKPLPSLSKSLKDAGIVRSRMIIPTASSLWRQDDMCRQYGFDALYDCSHYVGMHTETLTDEQVFELSCRIDKESHEDGFFSVILTASMHNPYNKIWDNSFIINNYSMTPELRNYLNVCHYTDNAIKKYFESLKKIGLYDKSLIVIAADHQVPETSNLGPIKTTNLPVFIINGGIGRRGWRGDCNQLDIYTTLLDIMGLKDTWPGLGRSLLNEDYQENLSEDKWNASEWILLGDYLNQ